MELECRKRKALDESSDVEPITKLPSKKRGRRLFLEQYDAQVQEYVRQLRLLEVLSIQLLC